MEFFFIDPITPEETESEKANKETLEKILKFAKAQTTFTNWIAETDDPELVEFFIECLIRNDEVFTRTKSNIKEHIRTGKGDLKKIKDHCIALGVVEPLETGAIDDNVENKIIERE